MIKSAAARAFSSVSVTKEGMVAKVTLEKPVMGFGFWNDFHEAVTSVSRDPATRCVVLSSASKVFSFGLDVKDAKQIELLTGKDIDAARKADTLRRFLLHFQSAFTVMETAPPVISCVHSFCIGGAMDLICATDIRYCTKDASFSIKEVDVGLAPDLGTLQRIERIVKSSSLVRELAFTGRQMDSNEALSCGFVSRVFNTKQEMLDAANELANVIASKSPVAISGIKANLNYARGRSVEQSLEYQALWSSAALQSVDVETGLHAAANVKTAPKTTFQNLTKY